MLAYLLFGFEGVVIMVLAVLVLEAVHIIAE